MRLDKGIYRTFEIVVVILFMAVLPLNAQAAGDLDDREGDNPVFQTIALGVTDPVENIIGQELFAIKSRNAARAFSLMTEKFHEKYDDEDEFLQQVRFDERPMYNYKNYNFLDQHTIKGGLIQKVELIDHNGDPTLVIFKLVKQDQGKWLIDSYTVLDDIDGPSI